jgi:hypothetical protein
MHLARTVAAVLLMLVPEVLMACDTHDCDASSIDGGRGMVLNPGGDPVIWQSAPAEGPWLDFPGEATVTFTYPEGFGSPWQWWVFVSTEPYQGPGGGTSTEATGQLGAVTSVTNGGITVTNASCAEYYVRVVAEMLPTGASPSRDAGLDAR